MQRGLRPRFYRYSRRGRVHTETVQSSPGQQPLRCQALRGTDALSPHHDVLVRVDRLADVQLEKRGVRTDTVISAQAGEGVANEVLLGECIGADKERESMSGKRRPW